MASDVVPSLNDSVRVLHVLAPAPFGGLESVVLDLAILQAGAGYDVHVAGIVEEGTGKPQLQERLRVSGSVYHAIVVRKRRYRSERRQLDKLLGDVRPQIVHTHGYRADVLHHAAPRRRGIPVVSTVHGFTAGDFKNRLYEKIQRRMLRRFDAVVAVSRPMARMLSASGIADDRLRCIPNAWSGATVRFMDRSTAREALQLSAEASYVAFIGRLSREKGPDVFLDAIARVSASTSAVFIGDGPLRGSLIERARSLGMTNVHVIGAVPFAARYMKAFDLVVVSSRTEGTPVVLLEAMAAGVPVVATRVGGIPDVISDAEANLVDSENAEALAKAIEHALREREMTRRKVASAASRLRSQFGSAEWLHRYDSVYRECLQMRRDSHG